MEITEEMMLEKQIKLELKNALKAEERKDKQKKRLEKNINEEPPKKKEKKNTKTIPFVAVTDIPLLRRKFWTTIQYMPLLNRIVLFSGVTSETMAFNSYPILVAPFNKKDGPLRREQYLLGVSKPQIIFTILREAFKELHPDKPEGEYQFWTPYKWNKAYYGAKTEHLSYSSEFPAIQLLETKPFGGSKDAPSVNILEESKLKRWAKSIAIADFIAGIDISKIKSPKIPKCAISWKSNHLDNIKEGARRLKEEQEKAAKESENELNEKNIKEAMSQTMGGSGAAGYSDNSDCDSDD